MLTGSEAKLAAYTELKINGIKADKAVKSIILKDREQISRGIIVMYDIDQEETKEYMRKEDYQNLLGSGFTIEVKDCDPECSINNTIIISECLMNECGIVATAGEIRLFICKFTYLKDNKQVKKYKNKE